MSSHWHSIHECSIGHLVHISPSDQLELGGNAHTPTSKLGQRMSKAVFLKSQSPKIRCLELKLMRRFHFLWLQSLQQNSPAGKGMQKYPICKGIQNEDLSFSFQIGRVWRVRRLVSGRQSMSSGLRSESSVHLDTMIRFVISAREFSLFVEFVAFVTCATCITCVTFIRWLICH